MRTYCNQGTIFRTISLLLLSLLPARYLPEFFTGYSLPLVTLAAVLGGLVAARSRIRLLPLGLFAGLSCLLVRVLLSAAATLPVFSVHRIYLHITLVFYPSALFFVLVFTATAAGFRKRAWRSLEPLVLLILFAAFFWAQGNHSLTLFPHPFKAALYVVFFIVTIIGSLIFSNTDSRKPYGILAGIVPIFLALTVLFLGTYNAQSVANTGGLIQPTLFRFDFSPYLSLQNEISLNNKLVCIVHTPEQYSRNFLRRVYLSGWDPERGFYEKPVPGEPPQITSVPAIPTTIPAEERLLREEVSQEVFIVNFDPKSLIAMDYPVEVTPYAMWQHASFNGAYKVTSHTTGFIPFELYDSPFPVPGTDLPDETYEVYTEIDPETKAMLQPLVEDISGQFTGYYDIILLLNEFLRNGEYRYSLKPGPSQTGNQLEHFLFSSRKGYCTYFAFSLCLMLRTAGIPSRVAAGFFLDSESSSLDYFPVRSNMAHAWVEVFFPEYGWISFDPTTNRIAEGEELLLMNNAGGDDFISLLNEIIDNRGLLYSPSPGEEPQTGTGFFQQAAQYLPNLARTVSLIVLVCLLLAVPAIRLRERLILRYSTNNRRIILLCAKRVNRHTKKHRKPPAIRTENQQRLHALEQKARFAPRCTREDADEALDLAKTLSSKRSSLHRSVLLLFVVLLAVPSLEAQTTAQELVSLAEKSIAGENWETAVATLTRGKALYPEDPRFPFVLGTVYEKEKLYEPAKKEFLTALSLGMNNPADLYEHLASCYGYLNEDEEALVWQRKYLALVPDDLYGWSNFGWLCYKTNKLEEGITALLGILEHYGPDGNLYVGLGNLYTSAFDYENAKKFYTLAVSFARENQQNFLGSIYLYNRSILEEIFYKFDDAYEDTARSLRAASRSSGYLMQGELELRRLDFSAALTRYQKAYSLDSTPLASLGLADTLVQAGFPEEAAPYLEAITNRKDLSWIANYGTTPDQFKADISRIQRDRNKILLSREKRRIIHNFSTAVTRFVDTIRYSARVWFHDGLFRIYSKRVAHFYERGGNPLYYNSFYYLAYDAWPNIARQYLARAQEQEVLLIPQAKPSYRFEQARMGRNPTGFLEVIQELHPVWEKNYLSKAVSEYLVQVNPKKSRNSRQLYSFLYTLQPAAFLVQDIDLPVSLHISGTNSREERILRRGLTRAGFVSTPEAAFTCSIRCSSDSIQISIHNAQNAEVYAQVIHRKDTMQKDVAEMITSMVKELFRTSLGI